MLPPRRLGMARRAGDQAKAGPQASFRPVLGEQERGLIFASVSDYYLHIIMGVLRGVHCPRQQLEHPSSTAGQHDNPPARPASAVSTPAPCVLFPYYPPMVWLCSAHGMHMRVSCCYIKRLLFVYLSEIKCVINGCWMPIGFEGFGQGDAGAVGSGGTGSALGG